MPVYQEKDKSKWTKDGRSYYFRCYYTDKYGKRKQKISKLFKTKSECKLAENNFLVLIHKIDEPEYDVSFEKIFFEWIEKKKCLVKTTTFYCIKGKTLKHILSFFKNYKLHSIKINTLNEWKDKLANSTINMESQNKIIGYMQEILEYSRCFYDFDIKVASSLNKHKVETVDKDNDSKWNYLTLEEFKKFIIVVDNDFYNLVFRFLYFTGLRIGEMIALNWNDFDFEKKQISITKTLSTKIEGKKYNITTPKTKNSIRIFDLDDDLFNRLVQHYLSESKIYNFNKNMFIFGNIKYISETTLRRNLNKYMKLSNIKSKNPNYKEGNSIITPHGFRHSHASLLINIGLDFKDVAERLGDTIRMVQTTYYHMFPEKKSLTVKALNNLNLIEN